MELEGAINRRIATKAKKKHMSEANQLNNKLIIGRKEKISFPELERTNIVARIDTGARSSSAHCDKIWLEEENGKKVVCCHFLKRSKKVVRFRKFRRRKVRSSNGIVQNRYVVQLMIRLGSISKFTDVTLTDRSTMNYSVLLGRRFLENDFIVDVSSSYLQSSRKIQPK